MFGNMAASMTSAWSCLYLTVAELGIVGSVVALFLTEDTDPFGSMNSADTTSEHVGLQLSVTHCHHTEELSLPSVKNTGCREKTHSHLQSCTVAK